MQRGFSITNCYDFMPISTKIKFVRTFSAAAAKIAVTVAHFRFSAERATAGTAPPCRAGLLRRARRRRAPLLCCCRERRMPRRFLRRKQKLVAEWLRKAPPLPGAKAGTAAAAGGFPPLPPLLAALPKRLKTRRLLRRRLPLRCLLFRRMRRSLR